jgi:hypothetical protein
MKKQIGLIGIGNCGSIVSNLGVKKYGDLFDAIYINTSDSDLSMIDANDSIKFKVGTKEEVEGSGKNRNKMKKHIKEYMKAIIENNEFRAMLGGKKYIFVISSTAGGTGSGAAPMLLDVLRNYYHETYFILVAVLPQIGASLMEQGNSLEYLNELYTDLGDKTTYMIYDNETTSDKSPTEGLDIVNDNIIEDLKVLSGVDNYPTPYESIDQGDLESIITTPGRLLVAKVNKGITEKVVEDIELDDLVIKTIKQSCHTETDRNKKVVRWGITTYFTEAVNRLYTNSFDKLIDFIGTPIERFNHNVINPGAENLNFLHLIASGMSPVNDRVKRITDRIEELKNALAGDDTNKYILAGEDMSYNGILSRKEEERNSSADFNMDSIMKKFMK